MSANFRSGMHTHCFGKSGKMILCILKGILPFCGPFVFLCLVFLMLSRLFIAAL